MYLYNGEESGEGAPKVHEGGDEGELTRVPVHEVRLDLQDLSEVVHR